MPYVVPRLLSVQYTGSNVEGLQQIIDTNDYWQSATRTVTTDHVLWIGPEGDRIMIPVSGYLVYSDGLGIVKGLSQDDYQIQYREV